MSNDELARRLREHASGLARLGDNLYRVRAFRQAALVVTGLPEDVTALLGRDGGKALEDIPGIGRSLAKTIQGYLGELVEMRESREARTSVASGTSGGSCVC